MHPLITDTEGETLQKRPTGRQALIGILFALFGVVVALAPPARRLPPHPMPPRTIRPSAMIEGLVLVPAIGAAIYAVGAIMDLLRG